MHELSRLDLDTFFHPCSQMSEYSDRAPVIIDRAQGAYYYDMSGRAILDGISSWWVNNLGHCYPPIAKAISAQSKRLAQGMLAGFSNEPIIRLSQNLVRITPPNLKKCFYGDSGSSAVEIALKLAFQAKAIDEGWAGENSKEQEAPHKHESEKKRSSLLALGNTDERLADFEICALNSCENSHFSPHAQADKQTSKAAQTQSAQSAQAHASQCENFSHTREKAAHLKPDLQNLTTQQSFSSKQPKDLYLCLSNSYHGETLGALSLSDVGIYKDVFAPLLFRPLIAKAPNRTLGISEEQAKADFIDTLKAHAERIAAFIAEPLLQCAGGMNMYSTRFLEFAVRECRKRGIYVIFDEIATGFGRTGKMFGLEYLSSDAMPDMICLSKGLTGGFLPLSVVVMSDEIYDKFYAPYGTGRDFLHSHSYAGNALACVAANAVIESFERDRVLDRVAKLGEVLEREWARLERVQGVQNVRTLGMVAAFELDLTQLKFWQDSVSDDLSKTPEKSSFNQTNTATNTLTSNKPKPRFSIDFFWRCVERGLFLRPLGNTVYFMPPYCINADEIVSVVDKISEIIDFYKHNRA